MQGINKKLSATAVSAAFALLSSAPAPAQAELIPAISAIPELPAVVVTTEAMSTMAETLAGTNVVSAPIVMMEKANNIWDHFFDKANYLQIADQLALGEQSVVTAMNTGDWIQGVYDIASIANLPVIPEMYTAYRDLISAYNRCLSMYNQYSKDGIHSMNDVRYALYNAKDIYDMALREMSDIKSIYTATGLTTKERVDEIRGATINLREYTNRIRQQFNEPEIERRRDSVSTAEATALRSVIKPSYKGTSVFGSDSAYGDTMDIKETTSWMESNGSRLLSLVQILIIVVMIMMTAKNMGAVMKGDHQKRDALFSLIFYGIIVLAMCEIIKAIFY